MIGFLLLIIPCVIALIVGVAMFVYQAYIDGNLLKLTIVTAIGAVWIGGSFYLMSKDKPMG